MLGYIKSRDFPIHLLAYWWVFWLAISYSDLNEFFAPSFDSLAQFAALIASFVTGHLVVRLTTELGFHAKGKRTVPFRGNSLRMRAAMRASVLGCAAMLLISLWLSGALTEGFVQYFAKLRLNEGGVESLTGIRSLDVLTKILAFPLSYTVILIVLANDTRRFRFTLATCILNLLAFSYLWQVNYPIVHLFWFLVFHSLVRAHRRRAFDRRTLMIMLTLVATLLASAANRFGGDVLGGLQRYVVGYHLVGFSFYDYQYQDPNSILHVHTLGRTSLGFLDQMLEAVLKMMGVSYQAASFENSAFTNAAIDIGAREVKEFNAFGTFLFGFYRDFHVVGIVVGGFAYGALATRTLYRSASNWVCGALFYFLASTWMVGMMVNPVEQAYFWFAIVALGMFSFLNRGMRLWGTAQPASSVGRPHPLQDGAKA